MRRQLLTIAFAAALTSCASSPPTSDVEKSAAPEDAAPNPEPGIEYDQAALQHLEQMAVRGFGTQSLKKGGYDDVQLEAERLDGKSALRMLQEEPNSGYKEVWTEFLQRDGALTIYVALPDELNLPTGFLFIPSPSSVQPPLDQPIPPPAFVTVMGVEPPGTENPELDDPAPVTDDLQDLPIATPDEIRALMSAGETFIIVHTSEACGASVHFGPRLLELVGETSGVGAVNLTGEPDPRATNDLAFELLGPSAGVPALAYVFEGEVVDHEIQADYWRARHFFTRNALIDEEPRWTVDLRQNSQSKRTFLRSLAQFREQGGSLGQELDFSGGKLAGISFGGADLTGATFVNTDLTRANFSHADLTDANFEGALLDGATWFRATCPDGTRLERNGTCENHMLTEAKP